MVWDRTNRPVWLRYAVAVLVVVLAAALRLQFLGILELRAAFLTFYPAVAIAALYGGFGAGLLATIVSAALADYFWMEPVGQFGITNSADLLSMAVFFASCTLISYMAEVAYRAQARAHKAEEHSKLSAEREKAAVDLHRSESKYRELVQNANSAIIRWNRDGTLTFFNEYAQKFFGYSAEEVIGKSIKILIAERESIGGDPAGLHQDIVNHPEKYANNINENILRDGSRVWMAWTNKPVFDQDGQVMEILSVGSDITGRKRVEEELKENQSRLNLALRSAHMGAWHLDIVENKRFFDDQVCHLLGIDPAKFTGAAEEFFDALHPDDRETVKAALARTIEQDAPYETEYRTIRPDGSFHYISTRGKLARDDSGRPMRINGIIWDTTERKRAEEEIYRQREWLRVTLTSIGDAVIATDASSKVTFINPVAKALTGWESGEVEGQPIQNVFRVINEQTRQPARNVVERVLREGNIVNLANHTALIARDGREIPIEDSAAPIRDKDGGVCGVVLVFHDVTERRRAREQVDSIARFPDENPNPILRISDDGKLLYANRNSEALLKSLGWKPGETLPDDWRQHALQALDSGSSREMELTCQEVVYSLLLVPVSGLGYLNIYGRDITERKQTEVLLQRQAELLHLSYDAIIVWRLGGRIETWNKGAEELYGYSQEEAVGRFTHDLLKTIHPGPWPQIEARLRERKFWEGELKHRTRDGREVIVSARHQLVRGADGIERVLEINRDITEPKRMEIERETTIELLKLVNQSVGTRDLIQAAVTFFQKQSGCEAVGIRLRQGDDFPYYEVRGFPEEFIHLENSLCARDAAGEILRDSSGDPYIECMCGNVILERTDPSKPFFTRGGSFWANDTSRLLSTTSDADRQTGTRNRCNGEGYESVALIPLHLGSERFGLLQLNDKRKGMFSPETIAIWERLAGYLSVALAKYRAEESLRESEARFRALVQASSDMVYQMSPDWQEMRHLSGRELIPDTESPGGAWLHKYIHPDDQPLVTAAINGAIRNKRIFELEHRVLRVDGSIGWTFSRAIPLKDQSGEIAAWFGAASDITERKHAEARLTADLAALTRMHALSGRILETGGMQLLLQEIMDAAVSVAGAEKGTLQLLEGDSLRIVAACGHQRPFLEFFASAEAQASVCGEATRRGARVLVSDVETSSLFIGTPSLAVLRDAGVRAVQSTPLMSRNGALLGILTTQWGVPYTPDEHDLWRIDLLARQAADLIDHSRAEGALIKSRDELELRVRERTAELNSYMAKLEQSNQALQEFASIAAHDMKEPLRKVMSFGNMLEHKYGDSLGPSGKDYLNRMLHSTERMQSLLTSLFEYSKVTMNPESFREIDLNDIIQEVLSDLEVRIVKTGGEVHVEKMPVISADPSQMLQLFQNLIGNALKFHKPDEKATVRIGFTSNTGSTCEITVEDNGIGFEERYLDRIFAPFQRLHGRSSQYEGTGMGLAICKKIVERHGGSITAKSTPGVGTNFIVQLPTRQSPSV